MRWPWPQVPALHPAKVKFPSSQGIYLDQVLADSSKPLSSSKLTLLTLHQPTIHHQLPRFSSDHHRLGSSLTALPDSTSLFLIKLTSIHKSAVSSSSIHLLNKLVKLFSCLLSVSLHVGQNN
ncbi:hypothetical protein ATANTOWER_030124 [Ataeniobius toweri]|uniref:Uncharacterized protein n=1 Tax=Ataeniobius toweri TaxID=208326 RepID=A0ABU7CDJ0_9TELE|nr:hypothetical protein [Ataeniobius toweri]